MIGLQFRAGVVTKPRGFLTDMNATMSARINPIAAALPELIDAVKEVATDATTRARASIQRGGRSGKLYTHFVKTKRRKRDIAAAKKEPDYWAKMPNGKWLPWYKRTVPHRAAGIGEPPKTDSGYSVGTITWALIGQGRGKRRMVAYSIGSFAKHMLYLEYGSKKARYTAHPWLAPTEEWSNKELLRKIDAIVSKHTPGGGAA